MKLSMTTTKFPVPLTRILINITKGLNLRESTENINFENEEKCKKIKENFGNGNFFFWDCFEERCFKFD